MRHDAPPGMREVVVDIAEDVGLPPSDLRTVLCRLLHLPSAGNWTEYPNIDSEVRQNLRCAEWWDVYDFIEVIHELLVRERTIRRRPGEVDPSARFEAEINRYFRRSGIGWQLVNGRIETRGPELVEVARKTAEALAEETGRDTAARELRQAHEDLSRRPVPDVTGAIQHALAALECVARHLTNSKDTLGTLIQRNPGLFPAPLDDVAKKLFGFASEMGRHLQEGREPSFDDAELVTSTAAALTTYLLRRSGQADAPDRTSNDLPF